VKILSFQEVGMISQIYSKIVFLVRKGFEVVVVDIFGVVAIVIVYNSILSWGVPEVVRFSVATMPLVAFLGMELRWFSKRRVASNMDRIEAVLVTGVIFFVCVASSYLYIHFQRPPEPPIFLGGGFIK